MFNSTSLLNIITRFVLLVISSGCLVSILHTNSCFAVFNIYVYDEDIKSPIIDVRNISIKNQLSKNIRVKANMIEILTLAKAVHDAKEIKDQAYTKILKMYAKSYIRSPDFYNFWRYMCIRKQIFSDKTKYPIKF